MSPPGGVAWSRPAPATTRCRWRLRRVRVGAHAKLAMPRHASPARIAACREQEAELIFTDTIHQAFAVAQKLVADEGRSMVHPFDGPRTAEGTATIGLELMRQVRGLDAVVVPVGGGGLCGGIAAAVKQINPRCQVFGVEPLGADAMYRSFQAGQPGAAGARRHHRRQPGRAVCARLQLRRVPALRRRDRAGRRRRARRCACSTCSRDMKLVAEPAAAAATAALLGPLRERLDGKRVALVVCGSNIDAARFGELLARAT